MQQGVSSLPPASSQAIVYDEFDFDLGAVPHEEQLGPTVLRSKRTIGAGNWGLRLATSYFEINERLGPIDYRVDLDPESVFRTKFGTDVKAKVGVISLAATFGLSKSVDIDVNVPLVITDSAWAELSIESPNGPDGVLLLPLEGEEYDFDEATLRRFVWDVGLSFPFDWLSVDLGVGGSEYDSGIVWTPDMATVTLSEPGMSDKVIHLTGAATCRPHPKRVGPARRRRRRNPGCDRPWRSSLCIALQATVAGGAPPRGTLPHGRVRLLG